MFFGDNVIDLAPQIGIAFVNEAMFAEKIRPFGHQSPKADGNVGGHAERSLRARALASRIRCSSSMK